MMHRSDRLMSPNPFRDGRLGWSAALAGSLAVFVIALSVMLVMRAGWLDHALALSSSPGAQWLPAALAAGVLLGGISLLWLVLARFAREVEQAPYVWLAPVMTALPSIAIVAWGLTPPGGLPGRLFAIAWVPLLIGGGSLFRLFGPGRKLLGTILWALPAIWVLADTAAKGHGNIVQGWDSIPREAQMFTAVVTLTCLGVGLLAFLTRDRGLDARNLREERRQLAQERMSIAEERATLAGERAGLDGLVARAEAALGGQQAPLDLHEKSLLAPKKRPLWPLVLVPFMLAGGVLAYEFGHRRPMLEQSMALQALQKDRDGEMAELRSKLGTHHSDALAAMQAERDKAIAQRDSLANELDDLRRDNSLSLDGQAGRNPTPGSAAAARRARQAKQAQAAKPQQAKPEVPAARTRKTQQARAARTAQAKRRARVAAQKRARARAEKAAAKKRTRERAAAKARAKKPAGAKVGGSVNAESDDPLLGIDL